MIEPPRYNAWLHRYLVLVTGAVLFMIVAGGMVTSMDAGDAVPDWPLSYNSLLPPMVGNVFYEHGHRMIGWLLGFMAIFMVVWLKLAEPRTWVRRLGYIALSGVCLQGALGGLRVLIVSNDRVQDLFLSSPTGESVAAARVVIAVIHTASGQCILCLLAVIAAVTGRSWIAADPPKRSADAGRLRAICIATAAMVFVQLLLGALRRHTDGTIVFHLLGAVVVAILTALLARRVFTGFADVGTLMGPASFLLAAIGLQLALGVTSWLLTESAIGGDGPKAEVLGSAVIGSTMLTAHVAIGAGFLAICAVLTVRAFKHVTTADATQATAEFSARGRIATA